MDDWVSVQEYGLFWATPAELQHKWQRYCQHNTGWHRHSLPTHGGSYVWRAQIFPLDEQTQSEHQLLFLRKWHE